MRRRPMTIFPICGQNCLDHPSLGLRINSGNQSSRLENPLHETVYVPTVSVPFPETLRSQVMSRPLVPKKTRWTSAPGHDQITLPDEKIFVMQFAEIS